MESYRIPKERAKVLLEVAPNPPVEYLLFLSSFAEHHRGSETVSDLLADPALFMPAQAEGDGMIIIRKESVRWIQVLDPAKDEWLYLEEREGTEMLPIRCEFCEGDIMEGTIRALMPEGERRVLDVVNLQRGFLHLESAEGLYLVNLKRVHSFRLLEGTHGSAR